MDRGAWWATVHEVTKEADATERLKHNNSVIQDPVHFEFFGWCPCFL